MPVQQAAQCLACFAACFSLALWPRIPIPLASSASITECPPTIGLVEPCPSTSMPAFIFSAALPPASHAGSRRNPGFRRDLPMERIIQRLNAAGETAGSLFNGLDHTAIDTEQVDQTEYVMLGFCRAVARTQPRS